MTVSQVPLQKESGTIIFEKAESMFEQRSYESALKIYFEYLNRFPNGSSADLALKKISTIQEYFGNQDAKLNTCRRLAVEYPNSPYAPVANYEIMMIFHNDGNFRQVILQASKIIEATNSKELLYRTLMILGQTYVSLDSPMEAVLFYNLAYSKADKSKKKYIINKIKMILNLLNKKEIDLLFSQLDDESIKSDLLYQIALLEYERENNNEAKKTLLRFLKRFPLHEDADQAKLIVAEINRRASFKRGLIGCILPLSGKYKTFGNRALEAIRLALDNYNLVNGKLDLQLIVRDTRSDAKTIELLVKDLDDQGVALIIGPMVTSEPAAVEAQKRGIPIITLTQKSGITETGGYVFRNFLTPDLQVESLVSCAIDQFGVERFAILYPDETYGSIFMNLFRKKAEYYGAGIAYIGSYSPDQTDFSALIKRLARIPEAQAKKIAAPHRTHVKKGSKQQKDDRIVLDFDAVFIPDESSKIALIAPQLTYWDINEVLLIGTNLWHSNHLIGLAQDYVQDAILTDVFYSQSTKNTVQIFIRSFEQLYGKRPGFIEGLAYDTAMIAFHTGADRKVQSRKDLKEKLLKTSNYDGVTGLTSFKSNGEAKKELYLLQISGGKFIELNDY
jgi:ABC-type branched-subunit amino acid transport system substrate-binding protein